MSLSYLYTSKHAQNQHLQAFYSLTSKTFEVLKMQSTDSTRANPAQNSTNLIRYVGITVFLCATWSLLAGSINLANDTSPSIAEKIINIPAAAAISLGGGIMFYYSRKTHLLESILIMAFGLVLFAAEVNTQFGSYAVSDTSYKTTSAAQQQENKTIALQEKELTDWDKVGYV